MCETSKSEACARVKRCDSLTLRLAYCTGISKPPKGTSLAPCTTCRAWRGVFKRGVVEEEEEEA
jgi:hypothetical protein